MVRQPAANSTAKRKTSTDDAPPSEYSRPSKKQKQNHVPDSASRSCSTPTSRQLSQKNAAAGPSTHPSSPSRISSRVPKPTMKKMAAADTVKRKAPRIFVEDPILSDSDSDELPRHILPLPSRKQAPSKSPKKPEASSNFIHLGAFELSSEGEDDARTRPPRKRVKKLIKSTNATEVIDLCSDDQAQPEKVSQLPTSSQANPTPSSSLVKQTARVQSRPTLFFVSPPKVVIQQHPEEPPLEELQESYKRAMEEHASSSSRGSQRRKSAFMPVKFSPPKRVISFSDLPMSPTLNTPSYFSRSLLSVAGSPPSNKKPSRTSPPLPSPFTHIQDPGQMDTDNPSERISMPSADDEPQSSIILDSCHSPIIEDMPPKPLTLPEAHHTSPSSNTQNIVSPDPNDEELDTLMDGLLDDTPQEIHLTVSADTHIANTLTILECSPHPQIEASAHSPLPLSTPLREISLPGSNSHNLVASPLEDPSPETPNQTSTLFEEGDESLGQRLPAAAQNITLEDLEVANVIEVTKMDSDPAREPARGPSSDEVLSSELPSTSYQPPSPTSPSPTSPSPTSLTPLDDPVKFGAGPLLLSTDANLRVESSPDCSLTSSIDSLSPLTPEQQHIIHPLIISRHPKAPGCGGLDCSDIFRMNMSALMSRFYKQDALEDDVSNLEFTYPDFY